MAKHICPSGLIDHIYSAMFGEEDWAVFLEALRDLLPDGQTFLAHYDGQHGRGSLQAFAGLEQDWADKYGRYYHALNPWLPQAAVRPLRQVVRTDQMLPRETLEGTEYFNDFLRPQGVTTGFGVTIRREGASNLLFAAYSSDVEEDQGREYIRCMQALVPHLERAFSQLPTPRHHGPGTVSPDCGRIDIGPGERVLQANEAALRLIEGDCGIVIDAMGRLICRSARLHEAIEAALSGWRSDEPFVRTVALLRPNRALPVRATVIRIAGAGRGGLRDEHCTLLLEDPDHALREAVELFGDLHGLTAAERRVLASLAAGLTVEETARAAGTAAGTVRMQLKTIFSKSGLHRQVDLVRHVSALAAGPPLLSSR